MTYTVVRLRSWHLSDCRVDGSFHLLCGRWANEGREQRPDTPGDEKTCERCYLIARRLEERSMEV